MKGIVVKKFLLLGLALVPAAMFAEGAAHETDYDIVQRTVNFIIFAGILWYLLADKIKAFFSERSLSIQSELDKVQETLKASENKIADAEKQLEEAKKLAAEIVEGARTDIYAIKQKVSDAIDSDIANLNKNFDEMTKVELSKAKRAIVNEVLEELLKSENINLTQEELANIVLKKVA
jgi:F-type H+-transporting ATPase subunit b